jgi:hypothetical protein
MKVSQNPAASISRVDDYLVVWRAVYSSTTVSTFCKNLQPPSLSPELLTSKFTTCVTLSSTKTKGDTVWLRKNFEIYALLRYNATSSGNPLLTFRDNASAQFSRVKKSKNSWVSWPVKMWPIRCPETSVKDYHSKLRYTPEKRRSHQHRGGSLKSRKNYEFKKEWRELNLSRYLLCLLSNPHPSLKQAITHGGMCSCLLHSPNLPASVASEDSVLLPDEASSVCDQIPAFRRNVVSRNVGTRLPTVAASYPRAWNL